MVSIWTLWTYKRYDLDYIDSDQPWWCYDLISIINIIIIIITKSF